MKPFAHKKFKALNIIQIVLMALWFGMIIWGFINRRKADISLIDGIAMAISFLFVVIYLGNLLYNFRLLRVYHAAEYQLPFSKAFSSALLCIYAIFILFAMYLLFDLLYEFLVLKTFIGMPLKYRLFMCGLVALLFTVSFIGIWLVILQIKLLRILKRRQLAKSDELLAQLGMDSENPR